METTNLEFDHYLCERLGWRSVALMRRGLSAAEYLSWDIYYRRKAQREELESAKAGG
jgi:hypothetical protein